MDTEKKYIRLRESDIHPSDLIDKQLFMRQVAVGPDTLELWHKSGMLYVLDGYVSLSHHWSVTELQILVTRVRHDYREWLMHRNRLGHRRLLIVEDDTDLRHLYRFQLEEMYQSDWIDCVADGAEALFTMGALKPDIIISDLKMPGMDGFDMLDVLSDTGYLNNCRKIVITGLPEHHLNQKTVASESVSVLTKPVDFQSLQSVINATEIKHAEEEMPV